MARALYTCAECGEKEWVSGCNARAAESAAKFAERTKRVCPACYAKAKEAAKQAETAAAAQTAAEQNLPALEGSAKQVAWAETIRASKLTDMTALVGKLSAGDVRDKIEAALDTIKAQSSASWWIDRRDEPAHSILNRLVKR